MANGTFRIPIPRIATLYGSQTYLNDIGKDCVFSEASSSYLMLSVTLYVGSYSASHRALLMIPNNIVTTYLPIMDGDTAGSLRISCDGSKLSIVSSSFASVWVQNVTGWRMT